MYICRIFIHVSYSVIQLYQSCRELTFSLLQQVRVNSLSDSTNFLFKNCVFSFPFFHSIPSKKPRTNKYKKSTKSQMLRFTQVLHKMSMFRSHGQTCYKKKHSCQFSLPGSFVVQRTGFSCIVLQAYEEQHCLYQFYSNRLIDTMLQSRPVYKQNCENITCGIRERWILGFSCEFRPFIFGPNPLLSQDTEVKG